MNFRDPTIYKYDKGIEDAVNKMSYSDLLLTLAKCDELLGFEIPESYFRDAQAYIYFIKERLRYLNSGEIRE